VEVIGFINPKGGTGKSTIALHFAKSLGEKKKVLLLDLSISNPTITQWLRKPFDLISLNEALEGEKIKEAIYKTDNYNFDYIPLDLDKKLNYQKLTLAKEEIKKMSYDFVVVDYPPGKIDHESLNFLDSAFFVMDTTNSLFSCLKTKQTLQIKGIFIKGIILNKWLGKKEVTEEMISSFLDLPILTKIPNVSFKGNHSKKIEKQIKMLLAETYKIDYKFSPLDFLFLQ
jgi:cellulose biosynthesis protein BcsQ